MATCNMNSGLSLNVLIHQRVLVIEDKLIHFTVPDYDSLKTVTKMCVLLQAYCTALFWMFLGSVILPSFFMSYFSFSTEITATKKKLDHRPL